MTKSWDGTVTDLQNRLAIKDEGLGEVYSLAEASNILSVCRASIRNYLRDGKLGKLTIRGRVYVPEDDIDSLLTSVSAKRIAQRIKDHRQEQRGLPDIVEPVRYKLPDIMRTEPAE